MTTRPRRNLGAVLLVSAGLVACGGDDDDAADTTAAGVATTGAVATSAVATTTGDEGFPFEGPEGDYSIVLPGEPTSVPQEIPLPDGTTLPITLHVYEEAEFAAGVARFEYPAGSPLSLEGARDGAIASLPDAELSDSTPITLQGRDGLEFVANLDPGGADGYYISRVFLDDNLLYQIIYVGGDIAATDAEVVAFFDSFEFTEG